MSVKRYDSTGMFHWCPSKDIEKVILVSGTTTAKPLKYYAYLTYAIQNVKVSILRSFPSTLW